LSWVRSALQIEYTMTRGVYILTTRGFFPSPLRFCVFPPHIRSIRLIFHSLNIKMGIANFPFPSFTFVLTSDRVIIPGPSYVIRFAPLVVLHHPRTPQVTALMMVIGFCWLYLTTNLSIKQTNTANGDMEEERSENDSVSRFRITFYCQTSYFHRVQITDVALGHSDHEELVCDISKTPSVQREDEVENKVSFATRIGHFIPNLRLRQSPLLKMRRFRFKSIFKRLPTVTYSKA